MPIFNNQKKGHLKLKLDQPSTLPYRSACMTYFFTLYRMNLLGSSKLLGIAVCQI